MAGRKKKTLKCSENSVVSNGTGARTLRFPSFIVEDGYKRVKNVYEGLGMIGMKVWTLSTVSDLLICVYIKKRKRASQVSGPLSACMIGAAEDYFRGEEAGKD